MEINSIINNIIQYNNERNNINKELNKLSRKYHISTTITCLYDLFNIIDHLASTRKEAEKLKTIYILQYPHLKNEYLNLVGSLQLKPGKEFNNIFNTVFNDFEIIFNHIITIANSAYIEIYRAYSGRISMYFTHISIPHEKYSFKNIPINKSCLLYLQPFLKKIWDTYNNELYKKCKRGPKLMFKLWVVFQEFFTGEMFNTLVDRLKVYQDSFMIKYIAEGSRRELSQEWKDKILSAYAILKLAQN